MTPEQAAYTAGLLDGEGCFRIDRFRTARSPIGYQYRPVIEIAMCDLWPIQFVADASDRQTIQKKRIKSGKTVYLLAWRNGAAATLIRQILPYLLGKKAQAELLLRFNDEVAPGRGRTYRQEDFAICEEYFHKAKALKLVFAADCPIQ